MSNLAFNYWRNRSPRSKRILSILAFFLLTVIVTLVGVITPLSAQEVETKNNDLTQIQTEVQTMGFGQGVISIFSNNIVIGLLCFVPIAGPVLGSYISYNTGTYVAAQSITEGWPPALVFLLMFIYPHVWLEFFCLFHRICRKHLADSTHNATQDHRRAPKNRHLYCDLSRATDAGCNRRNGYHCHSVMNGIRFCRALLLSDLQAYVKRFRVLCQFAQTDNVNAS